MIEVIKQKRMDYHIALIKYLMNPANINMLKQLVTSAENNLPPQPTIVGEQITAEE